MDIGEFLTARLDEDEIWAREASRDDHGYVPTGAHWNWVETEHDEVLVPDPSASDMLESADGWVTRQALRSIEHFPTSFGADPGLPQFAISTVEEVRSAVAGHIIRHHPARVLREIAAKRRILERHSSSAGMHVCIIREYDAFEQHGWSTTPCPTLLDLAAPYADHPDYNSAWRTEG